ncbi:MAG: hypothetical protein K0R57_2899 [Paenibacillaceae bacterium]|jgi:hypothetical protein|nr:hypothetical protein [Paenibacillaceae bacterium]
MDNYRTKVQNRINILSLVAVGTALIYTVLTLYRDHLPDIPSFINGFHSGAFFGLELIVILFIVKFFRVRKNDAALKKLHIEENDERTGLIIQKAGSLGMVIVLVGLTVATIISGFFNTFIFFTLLGALLFILLVFYSLWIYFAKKI